MTLRSPMRKARSSRACRLLASVACLTSLAAVPTLGCAKLVFTQGVRDRFGLTGDDVRRLQFYTSDEVILRREVVDQSRKLQRSELVIKDDVRVEEVTISARTPCVALRVEGNYILCSFNKRDATAALWFAVRGGDESSAEGRRYQVVELENGLEEPGPFVPRWSKGYLVMWKGNKYHVVEGRSAHLLYEFDDSFKREKVKQTAPGWRVSEGVPPLAATDGGAAPPPVSGAAASSMSAEEEPFVVVIGDAAASPARAVPDASARD